MDQRPKPTATATQSTPPPPSPSQPPLRHQDDSDEDDDTVKQLQECSALYLSLQDCLVKTNRNWKSCQSEVLALKACNERRRHNSERS